MESKLLVLVDKLIHDLPQVRERALSSIFSKVSLCGTNKLHDFPSDKLAEGLIKFLNKESTSEAIDQCLWLMHELAKEHPSGSHELSQRGAIPLLESMPPSAMPNDTQPKDVILMIRNSIHDVAFATTDSYSDVQSCSPSRSMTSPSTSVLTSPIVTSSKRTITSPTIPPPNNTSSPTHSLRAGFVANLAYYHDGWRPAQVPVDSSDLRRLADIERLLCTADAASKTKGCIAMTQLVIDMPVEVLLERPHSLHAIAAALKAPISEYMHGTSDPSQRGVFDRLLAEILATLEVTASSLSLSVKRHVVSLIGGSPSRESAYAALKELNGDKGALWKSINQRYPSPLATSSHMFAISPTEMPDTSTPLSLCGAALLVLRACLPLVGQSSILCSRALNIVYKLLPLIAEENMPTGHIETDEEKMRALTVTRSGIVLRCLLDTFEGDELSLAPEQHEDDTVRMIPFNLLHFLVASSQVLPVAWLANGTQTSDPSLVVGDVVEDVLEQIAFSATIRRTHPSMASDCASALSILRPDRAQHLSVALNVLKDAERFKPIMTKDARYFTDRGAWMDEWLSCIDASLRNVLRYVNLKEEADTLASNAIFMWVIAGTSGAIIGDFDHSITWNQRLKVAERVVRDMLKFDQPEGVNDNSDIQSCSSSLRNAALDALASILIGELKCTAMEDLQQSGFEVVDKWEVDASSQLMQLLNSPTFSSILMVAVDELSKIDTDLEVVSNATTSIITYLSHVVNLEEADWPCGIQLHLSLSLCQEDHFKDTYRDKIANMDTTAFYLRSLFEDSSEVRLSGAQWLVNYSESGLPEVCLTESCRIPKDFMSCLKSHGEVEETRLMGHFSGNGDIQQLTSLVLDIRVSESTRITACRHLSHLIGLSITESNDVKIGSEDVVVSLTKAALILAAVPKGLSREIKDTCDKSSAALDLILSLLWAYPIIVRPILLEEEMNHNNKQESTLFTTLLPWLFAAGCPHPPLRLCAGKASLILWRVLFDPRDFMDKTMGAMSSSDEDVFPIGVLIAFPSPPLDCVSLSMKDMISTLLNKDKATSECYGGEIEWSSEVLKFVQSELRTLTGELDTREDSIMNYWCPIRSAALVKENMTRASSHAELKTCVIVAASRASVDGMFLNAFASQIDNVISWEKALHPLLSNIPNAARDYRLLQCALPLLLGMVASLSVQDRHLLTSKILVVMVPLLGQNETELLSTDFSSRNDNQTISQGTILPVRLLVLRLLKELASCSSDLALIIITDPQLSSLLLDIISSQLTGSCELTKRETLLLISSTARSLQVSSKIDSSSLRVLLPELLGRCMSCLSLPRLPDSWTHKGLVRTGIEAVSSLMALCSAMDSISSKDNEMLPRAVIVANHGGGRGRGLVHWCRRLCCDREASVRAFSFAILAILININDVWDSSEEDWTLSEACMTATRVVTDQSEVPLVRAVCIDVVSAQLKHGNDLSMKCAMSCMKALSSCDESVINTPCLAAASSRLILLLSSYSLENWDDMMWKSGVVAMLASWINPDLIGEEVDGYIVSGVAAQALRLSLASIDDVEFRAKLLTSTNILENIFWVLRFEGALETPVLIHHFAEVALLLNDILLSHCSSSSALLALNKEVAPLIAMSLARVLVIEDDGMNKEEMNRAQRAALRLAPTILSLPAWNNTITSHSSAALILWRALAKIRVIVSLPVVSTQASNHFSFKDSLLCHMALTAIVDSTPECIGNESIEYEEMATQLCSEVEAIHDTNLLVKQRGTQHSIKTVLGHKFQPRLLLLRSLSVHTQLSREVCLQLNSLVDRVWPLDIKHDTAPSCLELLIGIIGGMASCNEETSKLLCTTQRLSKPLSETNRSTFSSSSQSVTSRSTSMTSRTEDSKHAHVSVKKILLLMISPQTRGNTPVEESVIDEFITAGMTWRYLVQCSEGRMLLSSSLHPLITLMHHLLKASRQRRKEASNRLVSLLQVLVAASLHDHDFQDALFKTNGFAEFMLAVAEKTSFNNNEETLGGLNETIQFNTRAQFTDRSFCEDSENICSFEVRELLSLLIRNLAGLRGNKAKLCATSGILEFLLCSINSDQSKLVASASCALWAILHNSERAKSALRALNAEDIVIKVLDSMHKSRNEEDGQLPSSERSIRHLDMVLELITQ